MKNNVETIANHRVGFPGWVISLALFFSAVPFLLSLIGIDFGIIPDSHPSTASGPLKPVSAKEITRGWITYALFEWSSFCLAGFTSFLALILFRMKEDIQCAVIGIALFLGACTETFQILGVPGTMESTLKAAHLVPWVWAVSRLSGTLILMTGVGLLIFYGSHRIRNGFSRFILMSLLISLLTYGMIHWFTLGQPPPKTVYTDSWIFQPWQIPPLILYMLAGGLLFPALHRREKNYLSHSILIMLIPLTAAQLYMALGSNILFDHEFYSAQLVKTAAYLFPLTAYGIEIFKGYQEERLIVDSFGMVQKELNKLSGQSDMDLGAVGDGVFGIDYEGNATSINSSAQLILGYSEEEFIGKPFYEIIDHTGTDGETYARGKHPINVSIQSGEVFRESEAIFKRKDGTAFAAEYVTAPIEGDGQALGSVITFREIAERKILDGYFYKALKEVSKAREEAEAANKSKSMFLSIMSHEIRTPLSAILGYAQILQRYSSLKAEHKDFVRKIETSGNHLLELINDILDISKIESGEIELNTSDFDLHNLINGLAVMFRTRAEAKGLEFSLEGIDANPIYVHGDEGKLRQILVNLLGNAVKFTNKGSITFSMEKLSDDHYKFAVADTGNGISPEDQVHIFDPFKQGKEGFNSGGTGLGLSISWELAELMNGKLSLESKVDQGSTFSLTLHLEPAHNPVPLRSKRSREVKGLAGETHLKALVVDDAEENRFMLCKVLESIGIQVREAENGEKALEKVREFKPDIVFMDRRMPLMNGEEATRQIIKEFGAGRIKVVGVTASAFSHEQEVMLKAGCSLVIGKPFRIEQIFKSIQDLLGVKYEYTEATTGRKEIPAATHPASNEFSDMRIPAKMFLEFKDSLDKGDFTELEKQLANLGALGDKGKVLEKHLSNLARRHDYEGIMDLLEKIPVVGVMHD